MARLQIHALGDIAPSIPLKVKQFRANVIKLTCEIMTLATLIFMVVTGFFSLVEDGQNNDESHDGAREMQRYAYVCIVFTGLAIFHVILMMLVPDSKWAQLQLRVQETVGKNVARLSHSSRLAAVAPA